MISSNFVAKWLWVCGQFPVAAFEEAVQDACAQNYWFEPQWVRNRLEALLHPSAAQRAALEKVLHGRLPMAEPSGGEALHHIGLVAAGNLPLVCWADFLCAFAYLEQSAGAVAPVLEIKCSGKDSTLLPRVLERLLDPAFGWRTQVRFVGGRLAPQGQEFSPQVQALLFTGGAQAQSTYRAAYPHVPLLARTSRAGVGVVARAMTPEDWEGLAQDCFLYFGLGCRNVTQLWAPVGTNWTPFVSAVHRVLGATLGAHPHFRNAYRHARAVLTLQHESGTYVDGGGFMLYQALDLFPPTAVVHVAYYKRREEVTRFLESHGEFIQCVVGPTPVTYREAVNGAALEVVPYGQAQFPLFTQFADGLNPFAWLCQLP